MSDRKKHRSQWNDPLRQDTSRTDLREVGARTSINVIAKYLLLGCNCDNCWYMSPNDPVCTLNGGQWLAENNVCEVWMDRKNPSSDEIIMREG